MGGSGLRFRRRPFALTLVVAVGMRLIPGLAFMFIILAIMNSKGKPNKLSPQTANAPYRTASYELEYKLGEFAIRKRKFSNSYI